MLKHLLYTLLLSFLTIQVQAQSTWELQLNNNHKQTFEEAYRLYPNIPKGILEAVAYTTTRIRHVQPKQEIPSCIGLPSYHGVMGLVLDASGYFKNSLQTIAQLSRYTPEQIQSDPYINIMAYAKAYDQLIQNKNIRSNSPEDHISVLDALSELPNDGQLQNNFAFDSHIYSVFKTLNATKFQATYQLPTYKVDLEKIFGKERFEILSAQSLILDDKDIRTNAGAIYNNTGQRSVLAPPCSDLSGGFPYPVIQDGADPSNYSSRSGTAITHVTIHTMQGSYAGAISWFNNPSANVSAHYNLRSSDGQITQMVCEADKGWHVSNSNPYAVGIEHEGYVADPSWYTNIMYIVSAELTKDIAARNGIPIIRTYDVNGDNGTNPLSDGCFKVKGHQHFPAQSHTDPGQYWDWNRYYDLLNPTSAAPTSSFSTCTGSFFDSGGSAGNYANDERNFYLIEPTGATSVTLNFNSINLELNFDYLYIYNGDSHNDELIAILNGSSTPAAITATSGKMLLEFRTDCGTTATGWDASWTCSTTAASCGKPNALAVSNNALNSATLNWTTIAGASSYEIVVQQSIGTLPSTTYYSTTNSYDLTGLATDAKYLWSVRAICSVGDTSALEGSQFINAVATSDATSTSCSGTFTDTGGELGLYRKNEDYTFTIAPVNATSVNLTFSAFDIEAAWDYLYIYDGPTIASPLLGTYTGTTAPPLTTSTAGALTIRFTSDIATQNPGWVANWTCVDLPTYPNPILLDSSMIGNLNCGIAYHDYYDSGDVGGLYGNNENNTQTFCNPDPSKAIRLSFRPNPSANQQLTISSLANGNDYLYFYNGPDESSNLIGVYTGASSAAPQPGSFVSSGACLTVKMNTDGSFVGNGWIARLYCSDRPADLGTVEVGGTEGTKVFSDLGGTTADYGNNENYTITYCPHTSAPAGEAVWANFPAAVGLERNWDFLYVFDGTTTDQSRLICAYTGDAANQNTLETIKATIESGNGCLTFQFFSDGATRASGWAANMSTGEARLPFAAEDCNNATLINQTGKDYAASTATATGTPGTSDPSLNISLGALPECSGLNTITRLENTVWYRFTTPDALCIPTSMNIVINNISCQSEDVGGSGVQFVLYEVNNCASGAGWPTPVYCADKLTSGSSVDVASILLPSTNYYLMLDGFTGQHCNLDLRLDVTTAGDPLSCSLPLDLLDFWGDKLNNTNQLQWETANEDNVLGFYIQRAKSNGTEFDEIGFVPSTTSNLSGALYQFNDNDYWRNAVNYYRLRQVDNDGLQNYSPMISLDRRNNTETLPVKVYPNPAKDWIVFALDNPSDSNYKLRIYNITGKIVYELNGQIPTGYWTEQLNTSQLAAGMYVYQLQIGSQTIHGKFEKL
jgi:hypothetical protein